MEFDDEELLNALENAVEPAGHESKFYCTARGKTADHGHRRLLFKVAGPPALSEVFAHPPTPPPPLSPSLSDSE